VEKACVYAKKEEDDGLTSCLAGISLLSIDFWRLATIREICVLSFSCGANFPVMDGLITVRLMVHQSHLLALVGMTLCLSLFFAVGVKRPLFTLDYIDTFTTVTRSIDLYWSSVCSQVFLHVWLMSSIYQ
jgi:hypothetical protein